VACGQLLHAVTIAVELARRQWEQGHQRFDAESRADPRRQQLLLDALEAVTGELRKRIGQTFTLDELASAYNRADDWVREAIAERTPFPGWPRSATTVQDAAFHLYARGASDYTP
jgi:hypothetical protein